MATDEREFNVRTRGFPPEWSRLLKRRAWRSNSTSSLIDVCSSAHLKILQQRIGIWQWHWIEVMKRVLAGFLVALTPFYSAINILLFWLQKSFKSHDIQCHLCHCCLSSCHLKYFLCQEQVSIYLKNNESHHFMKSKRMKYRHEWAQLARSLMPNNVKRHIEKWQCRIREFGARQHVSLKVTHIHENAILNWRSDCLGYLLVLGLWVFFF